MIIKLFKKRYEIIWPGVENYGEWFLIPTISFYANRSITGNKIVFVDIRFTFLLWKTGLSIYLPHRIHGID